MIDYLAKQEANTIVIGWALSMAGWLLAAFGFGVAAMLLPSVVAGVVSVVLFLTAPLSVVLLIAIGKRQDEVLKTTR